MKRQIHGARLLLSAGIAVTLAIGMLAGGGTANAAGPTAVKLGTAESFAVLAGTGITNTGATTINGDVGSYPTTSQTGFGTVVLTGTNHHGDAVTQGAKSALKTAYGDAFGRTPPTQTIHILGGQTLVGGVYNAGGFTLGLTGTLTLNGQDDPSSVWIFQATSDLITASASRVKFINGGDPCNVFWQVTSSATLGKGSTFVGTIMALTSITLASGVTVDGRVLARNGDVTLINDTITRSTCSAVTPSGSSTASSSATATSTASPSTRASATPPTTSTANRPVRGDSMPILALLTCLALGGLGVAAVEAQRRRIRR